MKLISWNVNGLRAIHKKGFREWFEQEAPDILCLQETKISEDQLTAELSEFDGYSADWSFAEKRGYSGVVTFSRTKPKQVTYGLGKPEFDREGRVVQTDYRNLSLFNIYFPNGKRDQERLDYKLAFYDYLLVKLKKLLKEGRKVIVCGDVNTAHNEIDLARPKENEKISGFLPEERAWIDNFLEAGFIDTYRHLYPEQGEAYSWWSLRSGARQRNVGWRLDYFFVSQNLKRKIEGADIQSDVHGSDHCPVGLELSYKTP